jgi:RNA polymerase sigma factor (sigma-70 family)
MQELTANDRGAVADAARGRPITAEEFAARYAERVHRFATAMAPSGHDPQDLAQEALVKALRALDRFNSDQGAMEAWLWRIVANTAHDAGRLDGRVQALVDRWRLERNAAPAETSPEDVAIRRIGDADLLAAVRRLPRRYRVVIALRFGAGLTFPEVAEAMGTSRMAVQQAMRRALDRLRNDPEVHL